MKRPSDFKRIMLYREACDMRKQINGLAEIVQESMEEDPFSADLYLFCNRKKDILKAVYFDRAGFCLWVKKLDKQRFPWLRKHNQPKVVVRAEDLELIFDGVDVFKRHEKLNFKSLY